MKQNILNLGKIIFRNELISGSSVVFIGSTISNFLAFLFNIFLLRHLPDANYGEYAALITIITLIAIPAQSLSPIIVRFAGVFLANKQINKASMFYTQTSYFTFIISIGLLFLFLIFSSKVGTFLRISNSYLLFLACITTIVIYLSFVNISFLQSMLKFTFLSFTTITGAIIKLMLGIVFILIGFKAGGALWAVFFSFIIPYVITFVPLRPIIFHKRIAEKIQIREIIQYALPTILTGLALASFTSTDIILIKHFFSPQNAGLYAKLSLIGRTIFYFTAPITTVMFPLVVKRHEQGKNFHRIFYITLILVFIPSLVITIFYFIFPSLVIRLFIGGEANFSLVGYIGWIGLYLSIFSVLNVLVNFFLSLGKVKIALLVGAGSILQFILITNFHKNFSIVIFNSTAVVFVLFIILLLYYIKTYGYQATKREILSFIGNPFL